MNLNLPGNIISINDVKERKMKGEYTVSTRKLLLILFIGLWVIDCLIVAWMILHTLQG